MEIKLINQCCGQGYNYFVKFKKYLVDNNIQHTQNIYRWKSDYGKQIRQKYGYKRKSPVIQVDDGVPVLANKWETLKIIEKQDNFLDNIETK